MFKSMNLLNLTRISLRKQPSFFAPGPSVSRETPLGPGAKKDGCFHRLNENQIFTIFLRELYSRVSVQTALKSSHKSHPNN